MDKPQDGKNSQCKDDDSTGCNFNEKPFEKAFRQEQQAIDAAIVAFDIDQFTAEAGVTLEKNIPGVGLVKYQLLNYAENKAFGQKLTEQGILDLGDRGLCIIAEMMRRADGKTTPDKLRKLSSGKANKIIDALGTSAGFL